MTREWFDRVVAHFCASFPGWTIEYVELTLDGPRLKQLTRQLTEDPPIHLLVKWFVGYEAPPEPPKTEEERLNAFVAAFGMAGGSVH